MKRLEVESMGTKVQGVRLLGSFTNPEPESFRVVLGDWGDVDIVRQHGGDYWVHVRVNKPALDGGDPEREEGFVRDARVDHVDKHASETIELAEQLAHPRCVHAAIRVGRTS